MKKEGIISKLLNKLDKSLKEKSDSKGGCCCSGDDSKDKGSKGGSCCG